MKVLIEIELPDRKLPEARIEWIIGVLKQSLWKIRAVKTGDTVRLTNLASEEEVGTARVVE